MKKLNWFNLSLQMIIGNEILHCSCKNGSVLFIYLNYLAYAENMLILNFGSKTIRENIKLFPSGFFKYKGRKFPGTT